MANIAQPGFRPIRGTNGVRISYSRRRVLSNNTNPISQYDAVVIDSAGDTIRATVVTTAVASSACGVSYVDSRDGRKGAKDLPAATTYTGTIVDPINSSYVFIVENPVNVDFKASVAVSAIALTDLDLNYAMVLGAPSNGYSGHTLTATGRAVTATLPWRVKEFYFDDTSNDPDLINTAVYCTVNAGMIEPALSAYLGT